MLQNLNFKSKTLKILSLILSLTGIIFILASKHIGSLSIRLAMIILIGFCLANLKMTYSCLSMKEKTSYLAGVIAAFAGLYKPEAVMLFLGIFILYLSLPVYLKAIKNQDFTDVINLIISGTGILFALFCIFNAKGALQTIIIIIGILFTVTGCISLYQALTQRRDTMFNEDTKEDLSGFEDNTSS